MDSLHIFLHLNQCHRYHPVCKYQMPRFCLLSPVYVQVGMNFQVSRTAAVDAESIHCTGTKPRNSHESTTPLIVGIRAHNSQYSREVQITSYWATLSRLPGGYGQLEFASYNCCSWVDVGRSTALASHFIYTLPIWGITCILGMGAWKALMVIDHFEQMQNYGFVVMFPSTEKLVDVSGMDC